MGEHQRPVALEHGPSLGQRLRQERERHNWSQEQLASALGEHGAIISVSSINRWEHDRALPRPYYRDLLCRVFNLNHDALFGPVEGNVAESAEIPHEQPLWTVPYLRNRYFTGRGDVLSQLHAALGQQQTVALTALSGLGGIGKTQTALEYAYRYGEEYDSVLWMHAESLQALLSDYVLLAELLRLPERQHAEQERVVRAVVRWLQHTSQHWLLILDNVEHLEQVVEFLPTRGTGHMLLTTRSQASGVAIESIELDTLDREEGALFLLRRAKRLSARTSLEQAGENERGESQAICELLGGLPLALDQAGAYIEENQCRLADYLQLYQTRRADLLRRPGRGGARTTSQVVATTWTLSFEQVEQINPAAADLLRVCAFLHPDGIPEAMLLAGAANLGPVLQPVAADPLLWDEAIGVLRRYSLLRRNAETKTLTLHRLVQVVLKDAMMPEVYREWAERAVRVVSRAFPEVEYASWPTCQAYLPHALLCAALIEQGDMQLPEAALLLHRVGRYLYERGRYSEAESFFQRALAIREQVLDPNHLDTAKSLNNLALLYSFQGKYEPSKVLYQRALAIREQALGPTHPDTARILNNLAVIYWFQEKHEQAEPLLQRALTIWELVLGPNHPDTAHPMNNLASLYFAQGKYEQAEPLYQRVLAMREQHEGATHPNTAIGLVNLAELYRAQGKYELSESLIQRALVICEQELGPTHPQTASTLDGLASLYRDQGRYEQAQPLFQQTLAIREQQLGADHPDTARSLYDLATLYREQGRYAQAGPLFQRALTIREQQLGSDHPDTARSRSGLAILYRKEGQYEQAEPLFQQSLEILEQRLGPQHPTMAEVLKQYAMLLRQTQREAEAITLEARASAIRTAFQAGSTTSSPLELPLEEAGPDQQEQDPLANFLAACCELDAQASVSANELWQAYQEWCQDIAEQASMPRRAFAASLQARGCRPDRTRTSRIWRGLRLINPQVVPG